MRYRLMRLAMNMMAHWCWRTLLGLTQAEGAGCSQRKHLADHRADLEFRRDQIPDARLRRSEEPTRAELLRILLKGSE